MPFMYFSTSAGSTPSGNMKAIMNDASTTLRKPSCSSTWNDSPQTLTAGRSRPTRDIDARPDRAAEAELDLLARHVRLERLDRGVVAAGVIADRDLLAGELLRRGDRRFRRHHDAARRDHIGLAPHRADLLGRRLVHGPVAGAGDVGLHALVAAALLVGLEGAGLQVGDLARCIDQLLRCPTTARAGIRSRALRRGNSPSRAAIHSCSRPCG